MARHRYEVFVRRLGWTLGYPDGWEFDREDTVYVMALDSGRQDRGVAGLLPTTRPCLYREVFRGSPHHLPAPVSAEHIGVVVLRCRERKGDLLNAQRTVLVTCRHGPAAATLVCAAERGTHVRIPVSPCVQRRLKREGFVVHGGAPVPASWGASVCLSDRRSGMPGAI